MNSPLARIPCTIVTGFLGAGKTTLIRHVIANAQGRRLAVIVNEFGDVGIDGEILKGCGNTACPEENIVELANGCLCCTVADEFVPALDAILAREGIEHIVIETSGLALPKPLVQAFHWPAIKSRVTVDGVVVVVDGAALADGRVANDLDALAQQRAADSALAHDDPIEEVFEDQIACADLVVLNKRDLIDAAGFERAQAAIADVLPRSVKVITAADGKVDQALLLGLGVGTEDDIANRHTHHDDEEDHDHDDFDSFVVPLREVADPTALTTRVTALAENFDVLRVKGFAAVAGKPLRLLVQAVGARVTHQYDRPWAAAEARQGQLVVIGLKGLDRAAVIQALGWVRAGLSDASAHHDFDQPRRDCRSCRSRPVAGRHRRVVFRRQRSRRSRRRLGSGTRCNAERSPRAFARSSPSDVGRSMDRSRRRARQGDRCAPARRPRLVEIRHRAAVGAGARTQHRACGVAG